MQAVVPKVPGADDPDADGTVMFFNIGVQKGGTTWLHALLSAHPEVSTGPIKEYSYFYKFHRHLQQGPASLPAFQWLRRKVALAAVLRRAGLAKTSLGAMPAALSGRYEYKALLRGTRAGVRAFGDISPQYALLGRDAFAEMAACHPRTRFILIIRDPVDRLWSQVRMRFRNRRGRVSEDDPAYARMLMSADLPRFIGHSDYRRIITELEAAVPGDDILYLFYDRLFTEASVRRLCAFLGIGYHPADLLGTRLNMGLHATPPAAWTAKMRARLDHVYEFLASRFGGDLPQGWTERPTSFVSGQDLRLEAAK